MSATASSSRITAAVGVTVRPRGPALGRAVERLRRPRGLSRTSLLAFLEELSDLLDAGVGLLPALKIIGETATDPTLTRTALAVRDRLTRGQTLSEALADVGIPPLVAAALRAGEESGELVGVLRHLGEGLRQEQQFKAEIRKAMAYPVIVLTILLGVMGLFLTQVLPKLAQVLPRGNLPLVTRLILGLSRGVLVGWPLLLLGGGGLAFLARRVLRSEARYGLPLVGPLVQHLALARLFGTLALLLRTGVVLDRALEVAQQAAADPGVPGRLKRLQLRLQQGVGFAEALKLDPLFPPLCAQLVAVGEQTGQLHAYLEKLQGFSRRQVERRLKLITAALGPVLLLVVAGAILSLFFGFVLPIYQGLSQLGAS